MDTLSTLPNDIKLYELFYKHLDPNTASALCQTSSEFQRFCKDRKVRVRTFATYYSSLPEDKVITLFKNYLIYDTLTIKEGEKLEAMLRAYPDLINKKVQHYSEDGKTLSQPLGICNNALATYILLKYGANPNNIIEFDTFWQPYIIKYAFSLSRGPYDENMGIFRLLLAFGANINAIDSYGRKVADVPSIIGHLELIDILVRNNATFNREVLISYIPSAIYYGEYVLILESGFDISTYTSDVEDLKRVSLFESEWPLMILLGMCYGMDVDLSLIGKASFSEDVARTVTQVDNEDHRQQLYYIYDVIQEARRALQQIASLQPHEYYAYLIKQRFETIIYLQTHHIMKRPEWSDFVEADFWIYKYQQDYNSIPIGDPKVAYRQRYLYVDITVKHETISLSYHGRRGFGTAMLLSSSAPSNMEVTILGFTDRYSFMTIYSILGLRGLFYDEPEKALYNDLLEYKGKVYNELPTKKYTMKLMGVKVQFDDLQFFNGYIKYCNVVGLDYRKQYKELTTVILD